jgi:hypothetical protein
VAAELAGSTAAQAALAEGWGGRTISRSFLVRVIQWWSQMKLRIGSMVLFLDRLLLLAKIVIL